MHAIEIQRRTFLRHGGAAFAGLAALNTPLLAWAFPSRQGEIVIPWTDQPPDNPVPDIVQSPLRWEQLDSWLTPTDKFFGVAHYGWPTIDTATWSLEIGGLVQRPMALSLASIKARPRQDVVFTLECSGNHGFPWFIGGIGTAKWAGTPLHAILKEAGVQDDGVEVVFFGSDTGEEEVRAIKMPQNFARSMSLADAMNPNNILCYEMNDAPLPPRHGYPLRLIAPGWYGVANVKWLKRIEVWPRRYAGRFMAKDYVTIREEERDGKSFWTQSTVGPTLLKSVPAKVTRRDGRYRIVGAAWGAPIAGVEVKIDGGPWRPAVIDQGETAPFAWKIWSLDWQDATPGEHRIASRAIDSAGRVQPAMDDPWIANKHTYWESNGQVTRLIRIGP